MTICKETEASKNRNQDESTPSVKWRWQDESEFHILYHGIAYPLELSGA